MQIITQILDFAFNNRELFGLAIIGILAFWYFAEARRRDSRREAGRAVADRLDAGLGGILGVGGAIIMTFTTLFITLGDNFIQLIAATGDIVATSPVVGTQIATILLGAGSILAGVPASWFVVAAVALLVFGVAWRRLQ